jgi:hypothetical protein
MLAIDQQLSKAGSMDTLIDYAFERLRSGIARK